MSREAWIVQQERRAKRIRVQRVTQRNRTSQKGNYSTFKLEYPNPSLDVLSEEFLGKLKNSVQTRSEK